MGGQRWLRPLGPLHQLDVAVPPGADEGNGDATDGPEGGSEATKQGPACSHQVHIHVQNTAHQHGNRRNG
jgi:hypothetical protein